MRAAQKLINGEYVAESGFSKSGHSGVACPMKVEVLGCSGGIGGGLRTTSILVDDRILIDVGTGIGVLSIEQLKRIKHVFLTHSHLDHTAGLPLFADTVFDSLLEEPLQIYARPETIDALKAHMFNDIMWPNFALLPDAENAVLRYRPIASGEQVSFGNVSLRAVEVHHSVPSVGYCIEANGQVLAFSGDTKTNKTLWPVLNAYKNLKALVIEVSFPNDQSDLAEQSGHYCPVTLARDLEKLEHSPEIWVTAMKPGTESVIFEEVEAAMPGKKINRLSAGDAFEL